MQPNSRSGKPMAEKLAAELISAANGDGGAIKKKMTHIEWLKQIRHLLISDSS